MKCQIKAFLLCTGYLIKYTKIPFLLDTLLSSPYHLPSEWAQGPPTQYSDHFAISRQCNQLLSSMHVMLMRLVTPQKRYSLPWSIIRGCLINDETQVQCPKCTLSMSRSMIHNFNYNLKLLPDTANVAWWCHLASTSWHISKLVGLESTLKRRVYLACSLLVMDHLYLYGTEGGRSDLQWGEGRVDGDG